MFFSARKVIEQQKNKKYERIPKELLDALNKNVSDQFVYRTFGEKDQVAILERVLRGDQPIQVSLKIKEFTEIPDAVEGMTYKEIQQYAYNTQQIMEFKFNGLMPEIIDKKRNLPLACRIYDGRPIDIAESGGTILITPPPFKSRKVYVQVDNVVEEMDFIQEKSEDCYTYNYRATGQHFSFKLSFYTKTNRMNATASINLHGTVPIKDIIKTLKLQLGFCNRTITLDGCMLITEVSNGVPQKIKDIIPTLEREISWWNCIHKLEGIFQQEISISLPLSKAQMLTLDKLYIGLVLKEAFIPTYESVNEIQISLKEAIDDSIIGKFITFTLKQSHDLSTVNIKHIIYDVIYLCNIRVLKYDVVNSEKYEYKLKIGNDMIHKSYIAHRYFLTEQEAEQSLNSLPHDAKPLSQFDIVRI